MGAGWLFCLCRDSDRKTKSGCPDCLIGIWDIGRRIAFAGIQDFTISGLDDGVSVQSLGPGFQNFESS